MGEGASAGRFPTQRRRGAKNAKISGSQQSAWLGCAVLVWGVCADAWREPAF